jgi:hypothetical protein
MEDHPAVASGVRHGRLSLAQAAEITTTAAASGVPGCVDELVSVARRVGLGGLKERARQIRLRAADPDELHRRQRCERGATHWTDGQGMVRLSARLSPEEGVGLVNRLEAETDRRWREAHRHGGGDSREQCAADALAGLVAGGGKGGPGRTDVVVVCDLRALLRGHAHPDEPCHIVGGGPLPVWRVRQLAADAFVKAVTHDGTRIDTVVHYGRHIPAVVRTALELGAPPGLEGLVCVEGDCDRRYGLELDHVDPYANWGPTSFGNLEPRCGPHHRDKTEADRKAGLLTGRSPPWPGC